MKTRTTPRLLSLLPTLLLALTLVLSGCQAPEQPSDDAPLVYVTIANGTLLISHAPVALTDHDNDGALTLNDALIGAHAAYHEDGTAAFAAATTEYGLSMTRLWGDESGAFGYMLNHAAVSSSLNAPVREGDHVCAYIYTDQVAWSDAYSYFDRDTATVTRGETLTLTLHAMQYDENFALVSSPVEGATVVINGKPIEARTDAQGKVTLPADALTEGELTVSATHDGMVLVPPVCLVTVQ